MVMFSFIGSVIALILGYILYGAFVDRVFGSTDAKVTPAKRMADGVDYVEMDWKKAFLIQFLNIAGTGPIFGAVAGAMWGPAAFIWIVFGCIFAGSVHDFLIGMLSVRQDGASVSEIVGKYLGENARKLMVAFSIVLRSEEHTSELQSRQYLVCRLLLEKKKKGSHTWSLAARRSARARVPERC